MELLELSSKNVFLRKKIKVPREVLKYHGSWHVCTKQSEHFRKGNVGNSYALRARHYQISHADIELLKFSFFNSCAWLRYNLLSFLLNQLHAIPYVISDLKKEVTHPFFSFPWISLLNIYATSFATTRSSIPLCATVDERQEWNEATKRKHISDLCPTLLSCKING